MLTGMKQCDKKGDKNSHVGYLRQALTLAKDRHGFCAPNPAAGALVVKEGSVLATGKHWAAGYAHAERAALEKLGERAQGATLYVTLEPCCHYGKTPPCTQIIIDAGIKRVYYSLRDPNPKVCGKGSQELIAAGIPCEQIALLDIDDFYQSYIYWTQHNRPFVTAKIAMSLDGKIAGAQGESIQITGSGLQNYTHQNRCKSDAILTTINTIIHDNPQLNIRLNNEVVKKPIYVIDSQLRLPLNAKVLMTALQLTIFHDKNADKKRKQLLKDQGVRCVEVKKDLNGLVLTDIIKIIGGDGVHDLWIEAGSCCFQSFLKQKLLNRALIYIALKILGPEAKLAFDKPLPLLDNAKTIQWQSYGQDAVCLIEY